MSTALVACEGLVHIYRTAKAEVVALQGLDLHVDEHELVAIVGRSGSGKTTLMNVLAGVEPPTAGDIRVDGRDLSRLTRSEREAYRRQSVGYVLQHAGANVAPYLTVHENVQAATQSGPHRYRARMATQVLEQLGLGERLHHRPAALAGHELQRLALATALANRPRLLLADEPTAELDSESASRLLQDLTAVIHEQNAAAVIVTHDPQLEDHVDRVVTIRDGRTSSETLRRAGEGAAEHEDLIAEEFAVLDRAGRLQLPREYVDALELDRRVRLTLDTDHIGVWPDNGTSRKS